MNKSVPSPSEISWEEYQRDPLPGWARRAGTLFDVPTANMETPPPGLDVAVCSVPYDATASTRIGARTGPTAIREASLAYASQARSRQVPELLHLRSGEKLRPTQSSIADFGDLHVYPSNPERQNGATMAEIMRLGMISSRLIVLGGEHSISYPIVAGFLEALSQKSPGRRLGYLQIDHHFDFGDVSVLHGRHYHGSNARRVAELPAMRPEAMAFVGMGDLTTAAQYQSMLESGITIRTMLDVRARGFATCLTEACEALLRTTDVLYVSIDIDVCDSATAPGTGHVTIGGINSAEFLSIADVLRRYPVAGLDVVEVNAQLDPSGVTAHLAARLLFEFLMLEAVPSVS
ncbi:MAG TPA: agmatinase family protein [Pyrinomonadaceae bacterium]|jgi:arginase family enzyme